MMCPAERVIGLYNENSGAKAAQKMSKTARTRRPSRPASSLRTSRYRPNSATSSDR